MATATEPTVIARQQSKPAIPPAERTVTYMPLGAKVQVELTMNMVRLYFCKPTKSGVEPPDAEVVKFMMMCKARELDPWVGDAFLTGFDGYNGPEFSLITAQQALMKRAELRPEYDGLESGVIVKSGDILEYRAGDLVLDNETLIGGWARLWRKDRTHPAYDAIKFSTFNTGLSRWKKDPAGMIVKCAESSVLRKTFPTQIGGLYSQEEMEHLSQERMDNRKAANTIEAPVTNRVELIKKFAEPPKLEDKKLTDETNQGDHMDDVNQEHPSEIEAYFSEATDNDEVEQCLNIYLAKAKTDEDREALKDFAAKRRAAIAKGK